MVGRLRVRPLLRAGRDQPHVTRGLRVRGEASCERDQRPDPGRVVVRPGRRRHGVRVRHRDHQAVRGRVPDPDHIARLPFARHLEPLVPDAQPDGSEPRRDPLVRLALRRARGGPLPLPSERNGEVVRLAPARRRRGERTTQSRCKHATNLSHVASCSVAAPARGAILARCEFRQPRAVQSRRSRGATRREAVGRRRHRRSPGVRPVQQGDLVARQGGPAAPPLPGCLRRGPPDHLTERPLPRGRQGVRRRRRHLPLRRRVPLGHARTVRLPPRRHRAEAESGTRASTRTREPEHRRHDPPRHPRHHADPDPHPPLRDAAVQDPPPRRQRGPQPPPHHPEQLVTTHHRGAKKLRSILATAAPTRSENENLALHLLTRPESPSPSSTRASAVRTRSRTSCGPTSTSSSKPTAGATTTIRSPAPTTATSSGSSKRLGYTVIRTTWAEMTTRPDRMLARVQRELTRVDPPARVGVEVRVDGQRPPVVHHPQPGRLEPVVAAAQRRVVDQLRGPEDAVGPGQRREDTQRIAVPLATRRFAQPAHRDALRSRGSATRSSPSVQRLRRPEHARLVRGDHHRHGHARSRRHGPGDVRGGLRRRRSRRSVPAGTRRGRPRRARRPRAAGWSRWA